MGRLLARFAAVRRGQPAPSGHAARIGAKLRSGAGSRRRRYQPLDRRFPISALHERQRVHRPGRRRCRDDLGSGAGAAQVGIPPDRVGVPARLRRRQRPLVRQRTRRLPFVAGDPGGGAGRPLRWPAARSTILRTSTCLPAASRRPIEIARARRSSLAERRCARPHRHRRPAVLRRPGQQLRDARHWQRDDARRLRAAPGALADWSVDQRLTTYDQTLVGRVLDGAPPGGHHGWRLRGSGAAAGRTRPLCRGPRSRKTLASGRATIETYTVMHTTAMGPRTPVLFGRLLATGEHASSPTRPTTRPRCTACRQDREGLGRHGRRCRTTGACNTFVLLID